MINPYQAPAQESFSTMPEGHLVAEFQLTGRQIRFAESRFLLHRCGVRLTLASIVMIGLAVAVAFDLPGFPSAGDPGGWYHLSLIFRELAVMAIAAAVYLLLIRKVTGQIREQLQSHGIVAGVDQRVVVREDQLIWTTSKGNFNIPIRQIRLNAQGKGLIIWVDTNLFIFVPRHASFSTGSYRIFVRDLMKLRMDTLKRDRPG